MREEDLIKIWKSGTNPGRLKFDRTNLMKEVQMEVEFFKKAVRFRDRREIIAAMLSIPIFILYIFLVPFILSKIASALIVCYSVFVILKLRNTGKRKPGDPGENFMKYLEATYDYVMEQRQLLNKAIIWYISPCIIFCMIFTLGFLELSEPPWVKIFVSFGIYILAGLGIWYLNHRAVKLKIDPKLSRVEKLIEAMRED